MKAMILAAGLGTRLRPLTNAIPKALVEVEKRPLLEIVLTRLIEAGVTEVIINVHHFPEQIEQYLQSKADFGIRIELSHEATLLDTGGGLKKAGYFFDDGQPFFLHNVDVLSDIDLNEMYRFHLAHGGLATLAVNRRETSRYLIFDREDKLCGWKSLENKSTIMAGQPVGKTQDLAFCGIHVISPKLLEMMTEAGAFSIFQSYLRLAKADEKIVAFRVDRYQWQDVGKYESYSKIK